MRLVSWMILAFTGCDRYARWPDGHLDLSSTWDSDLVAANDGLYVRLPHAGALVRVDPDDGSAETVDLGGAEPLRLTLAPDGEHLFVNSSWIVCDDDDPKIETVEDCPTRDRRTVYALDLVAGGALRGSYDLPAYLNAFAFSSDGRTVVAYLDEEGYASLDQYGDEAIVDLGAVSFLDLDSGALTTVSVGFAASNILFAQDDSKALVLSNTGAVVVDLSTFEVLVRYPFTLDADQEVDPTGAELTPDGRYALVSVRGSGDLYKLDLEVEAIDIISLADAPADVEVDPDSDQTVVVYSDRAQVDLIEHTYFDVTSIELDDPATDIYDLGGEVLLYNTASTGVRDVYRLDLETARLTEYVVGNPVEALWVPDTPGAALALLRPSGDYSGNDLEDYAAARYGLAVIDLEGEDAWSLTLSARPVGLELLDSEEGAFALLLLEGQDELLVVDLANPTAPATVALPADPIGIGTMPDGRFFITHQSGLGLVSFLDPASLALSTVGGFAASGLLRDDTLSTREEL